MNEKERNLRIAQTVRRDFACDGQTFQKGDFVALLDGRIVTVKKNADDAIAALRALEPDPKRGMVVEVSPLAVDVIRRVQ
jgi:dihydroxyacetone kinase-like predicted kinase